MNVSTLSVEDITPGEALPRLEKKIRLTAMMAYGAATWDFARIHYDAPHARSQGLPSPVVDGQMLGAFLTQLVQDWAGPRAFLQTLSFQNRGMVFPGDVVTCSGSVTNLQRNDGLILIEFTLWIDNQNGERVVGPASATVSLPSAADTQ